MSRASNEFKRLVDSLDDRQLERKLKSMREACAKLQGEVDYASRILRNRRKAALRVGRNDT